MKKLGIKVALFFTLISFLFTSCLDFWGGIAKGVMCPINRIYLYDDDDGYYKTKDASHPIEIDAGATKEVSYEIEYSVSTTREVTFKLTSTNESVAVPEEPELKTSLTKGSFKIKAIGKGDCQIKMYVEGYEDTYPGCDVVYVKVNPEKTVRIVDSDSNGKDLTNVTLCKGEYIYLYAENTYDTRSVRWSVPYGSNLKLTPDGLKCRVEALNKSKSETVTLSSSDGLKKDYCYFIVASPEDWSIRITNQDSIPDKIQPQVKFTLTCYVDVDSGIDNSVSWESSNKAVAVVNDNGEVTAISPGEAKISVSLSKYPEKRSEPVTIEVSRPDVKSHQNFWGKWTRTDKGWNYEIGETEVIFDGKSYNIQASTEDTLEVQGLGLDGALGKFTRISNNQINLYLGGKYDIYVPFYRQGGTNLSYKVKVVGFKDAINTSSRAAPTDEETITVKKGLKVKSQSEKYKSYTDEKETDEEGFVTLTAPVQGDRQTLTVIDEDTNDIVVVTGLKIETDGANMGTIPLVGKNDYSLKVTGTVEDKYTNNGYLYGNNFKKYPLILEITNISDIKSATSRCNIFTNDPNLIIDPAYKIKFDEKEGFIDSEDPLSSVTIVTMKPGAKMAIQLMVSYADLYENYKDAEIQVEIKNFSTKRVWSDYVPLRFFTGDMPITITTKNSVYNKEAALNGFLIYPDGNSKFFTVKHNSFTTLWVPIFGTLQNKAYKMVFSGATVTEEMSKSTEMRYRVMFNTESPSEKPYPDPEELYDFGENINGKNNNTEDNAMLIDKDFDAYLNEGDIDFYTINVQAALTYTRPHSNE